MSPRLILVSGLLAAGLSALPGGAAFAADTWHGEIRCGKMPPNLSALVGAFEMTIDGAHVTYRRPVHSTNSAQSSGTDETGSGTLTGYTVHLEGSAMLGTVTYTAVYEGQIEGNHADLHGEQVWKLRSQVEPFHRPCRIRLYP